MAGDERGQSDARPRAQPGDEAPAETADPEPGDSLSLPPREKLTRWEVVVRVGLVVGLVAGAISIGVAVYNAVDKDDKPPPPATVAKIDAVDRRVVVPSSGTSDLVGQPRGYGPGQLTLLGDTYTVKFTIRGPKKTLVLHSNMVDADNALPIPGYDRKVETVSHPGGVTSPLIDVWVRNPPKPGTYAVRATLEDTAGHEQATGESAPFRYR